MQALVVSGVRERGRERKGERGRREGGEREGRGREGGERKRVQSGRERGREGERECYIHAHNSLSGSENERYIYLCKVIKL